MTEARKLVEYIKQNVTNTWLRTRNYTATETDEELAKALIAELQDWQHSSEERVQFVAQIIASAQQRKVYLMRDMRNAVIEAMKKGPEGGLTSPQIHSIVAGSWEEVCDALGNLRDERTIDRVNDPTRDDPYPRYILVPDEAGG